jgi:hypothetical protein
MSQDTAHAKPNLEPDHGEETDRNPATFTGNAYDLTSLVALACAGVLLFLCGTCNMGFYCLPIFAAILGVVGLIAARQAVNPMRTRIWSWIGVGSGVLVLLLAAIAFVLYVGLILLMALASANAGQLREALQAWALL